MYLLVFLIVCVWSFAANRTAQYVIKRKPWHTVAWSLFAEVLERTETILVIIPVVLERDITIMIPSVLGNVLGDYLAAKKKKRKRNIKKKKEESEEGLLIPPST